MDKTSDVQQQANIYFNELLLDILKTIYSHVMPETGDHTLIAALEFNVEQDMKITSLEVSGRPVDYSEELLSLIGKKSKMIKRFPKVYLLKECLFEVGKDGELKITPTYLHNES